MTGTDVTTIRVGPFRVGGSDVVLWTNSHEFESAARRAFVDLVAPPGVASADRTVRFDVVRQPGAATTWGVYRDGQPCELELMDGAVLVHQQWELNRLAIESQPVAIHSAVVARRGHGALLLGASHSGKTTLAGWLAAYHDLDYLTDEVAAVDDRGRVVPFPRPLGVRADSPLAALAARQAGSTAVTDERLVPASGLGASIGTTPASVDLLVFPMFDASALGTVESLDQATTFDRLAELTPGLVGHGRVVFGRLCRMVAAAPAIAITYGDVSDAAKMVVDALDQVGAP